MIFEVIIIFSVVLVFLIILRRLPNILIKNQSRLSPQKENVDKLPLKKESQIFDFSESLDQADESFKDKNYQEAEKLYLELATHSPKNPKVYNRLGVLYLEQGNYSDAKEAFYQIIKSDDKKASRWYNYALACVGLQEYRNAIEALEKAISLDDKNKKYQVMLTDVKKKLRKIGVVKK